MCEPGQLPLLAVVIGAGATLLMDAFGLVQRRMLGVKPLDYGLVGRWLGHMPRGRFAHPAIGEAPAVRGERLIGWTAHYAIGIAFAAALLAFRGAHWICQPSIGPALMVGIGSVVFPFFVMQPALGAGIAASRTPRPGVARLRSLVTHAVFGLGLYVCASAIALLRRFLHS